MHRYISYAFLFSNLLNIRIKCNFQTSGPRDFPAHNVTLIRQMTRPVGASKLKIIRGA